MGIYIELHIFYEYFFRTLHPLYNQYNQTSELKVAWNNSKILMAIVDNF